MSDLESLIAKLEAATEGSRSLDGDIAVALGLVPVVATGRWRIAGRPDRDATFFEPKGGGVWEAPYWTTSIDAAATLVSGGKGWNVGHDGATVEGRNGPIQVGHTKPALALSIAALKAGAS